MKISELINLLNVQLEERGDVEVMLLAGNWEDYRCGALEIWPTVGEVGYFADYTFEYNDPNNKYTATVKDSGKPGKVGICSAPLKEAQ